MEMKKYSPIMVDTMERRKTMSKSWFVRADYTVYADNLESAIEEWNKHMYWEKRDNVIFDGLQEIYENNWEDSDD